MHPDREEPLCKAIDVLTTLLQEFNADENFHTANEIYKAIDLINESMDMKD